MRFLFLLLLATAHAETHVSPWDLAKLEAAPAYRWLKQDGPIHSLLYSGEHYKDQPTEVFAFYASPATVSGTPPPAAGFPGIVLIHGGGGTAFADWVLLWAKRGYAAIAMDLGGHRPQDPIWVEQAKGKVPAHAAKADTRTRLPNGGPNQGNPEKFDSIASDDVHDHWPYHAVANVIRAHSLLRSQSGVNADRTAVTGISWGGYTTCIVASIDHRFKVAVPVYGCGFLFEGESVQKPSIDRLGDLRQKWIDRYDPSKSLAKGRVPILFVNGTNDIHYPLDSYQKSFAVVPHRQKQMRIETRMPHGHQAGWAPSEIGRFIDSHCAGGDALAVPGPIVRAGDQVRLPYTSVRPIVSAHVHYTTDTGLRSKRTWQSRAAVVTAAEITAPFPPTGTNTWFITLIDDKGATVSSDVQFQD